MIVSIRRSFKLFKQPEKIGDIFEYKNIDYLIIGIEKVKLYNDELHVIYTCQNLTCDHEQSYGTEPDYTEFWLEMDIPKAKESMKSSFQLSRNVIETGRVFNHDDDYYRWITYTDLEFDYMTLKIRALAQPVYPLSPTQARKKLINHKKKRIGLSII